MTSEHGDLAATLDQTGRTALVTGANSGLGFEIASELARRGATVLLGCRSLDKAVAARDRILARTPGARVDHLPLDLADLDAVRAAANTVLTSHERLDLLINNAGLMATDLSRTAQGFETQFGVNHLGHFALTLDVLPLLAKSPGARVVTMSSFGHRAGALRLADPNARSSTYHRWPAYFQSKLANLLFAGELDRRLRAAVLDVASLSAHPGFARTDLGREGTGLTNRLAGLYMAIGSQSAAAGALPALRAALDACAHSGEFYGPRFFFRGAPVRETPSRRARDLASAAALWTTSEALTDRTFASALTRRPD